MSDQRALWQRVESIKRRVIEIVGERPAHAFRSTQAYQSYTAMCGEAYWAHKNDELDENLIQMLEESAERVIKISRSPG